MWEPVVTVPVGDAQCEQCHCCISMLCPVSTVSLGFSVHSYRIDTQRFHHKTKQWPCWEKVGNTFHSSGATLLFLLQASVCWTWRSSFHFQRLLHLCWPDCWRRLREKVSLNEEVTHFDVQLYSFPLVYNILKHLNLTIFCDLLHRTTCTNISFMSQ